MAQSSPRFFVALVTAPDPDTARNLAQSALAKRLVACANIHSGVESHYWWQGKLESTTEQLIQFKTTESKIASLRDLIELEHPYDVPEFVAFEICSGSHAYLDWIQRETSATETSI